MRIPQPKLNVIELAMWGALVATLAYLGGTNRTERRLQPFLSRGIAELLPLAERYGPARNSRYGEEWILRDFFQDERGGVFVDVGANHYQRDSNTYYLETQLGWSGLAIEPQAKFASDYASHRPRTRFVPLFVSDVSSRQAVLYVPRNDLLASFDKSVAESESTGPAQPISAHTTTLDDILDRNGIARIDFLSIDIELHEPQALKGFSVDRFRPRLVSIESHAPVRQQILEYFAKQGYVVSGKYLRADTENLWFTPIGDEEWSAVAKR
ncbi:MAG: FkbM family methyltransferase [Vicinamibacterales bacterium]